MGKLVSPEELHNFLMSIPPEQLKKKSDEVKKYLNSATDETLPEEDSEFLAQQLFDATLQYTLNTEKIAKATGLDENIILRLQSANPFVTKENFNKVQSYIENLHK